MGKKSNFFRCFVAGTTISDGRTITPEMIDQIVETFNPDTYTPRINVEHIRGFSPEPPFNGYGDVIAVEARTDDITIDGKVEKRKALYAQVDGNAQLVALAKADQKPFPSVELTPAYAGTDKVGLVGLAFTDSPASIATQKLQFSRSAPGTFRAHGDEAVKLELEADAADPSGIADALRTGFAGIAALFKREEPKSEDKPKEPANDNGIDAGAFATALEKMGDTFAAAIKPIADANAKLHADFTALTAKLEKTEQPINGRTVATGGGAAFATDC